MVNRVLFVIFALSASSLFAEAPSIGNVVVRQLWPWSGDVDVGFTVSGGNTAVKLTAQYDGVEPFVIPEGQLTGDFFDAAPGRRHVRWSPKRAGLDAKTLFNLKITVEPDDTDRTYLILNLFDGSYRYAATAPEGGWLADPANYQTNMVFRRVPKGTKTLGFPEDLRNLFGITAAYGKPRTATLTSDYYISVYPITDAQDEYAGARGEGRIVNISGNDRSYGTITYDALRGGANEVDGIDWPNTRHMVSVDSRIADYRSIVAETFPSEWIVDLPTVVQWEYAARADTPANQIYSVGGTASDSMETITNLIDQIAVWGHNKDDVIDDHVGQMKPNGWGIYDMIGLCFEWNLDWYISTTAVYTGVNPVGNTTGTSRVRRKGTVNNSGDIRNFTTAVLGSGDPSEKPFGYRLCINLKSLFKDRE